MRVAGCGCPSSSEQYLSGIASWAFMWRAATSASAALPMTGLIAFAIISTGALNYNPSLDPK